MKELSHVETKLLRGYWRRLPSLEKSSIIFLQSLGYEIKLKDIGLNSKHQVYLDNQERDLALFKLRLYKNGGLRSLGSPRSKE